MKDLLTWACHICNSRHCNCESPPERPTAPFPIGTKVLFEKTDTLLPHYLKQVGKIGEITAVWSSDWGPGYDLLMPNYARRLIVYWWEVKA